MKTFSTKLSRDYYKNVMTDFGAVGDGVTDDTAALLRAAAAFNAGSCIFMPAGNYKTTATILLSNNYPFQGQKWVGEGHTRSVFVPTGSGFNCITISGSPYFLGALEDFGINGAANTAIGIYGDTATQLYQCVWRNLFISTGGEGVHIENHFNLTLENVTTFAVGQSHGFVLRGGNTTLLNMCRATGFLGSSTVTITIANPAVVTWTAHSLLNGQLVVFSNSGGALPAHITGGQNYYIVSVTANTFQFSATPGGTPVDTHLDSQSGTQTAAVPAGSIQKAGFRIGSGATLLCCNGLDAGDYWGVFGAQGSFAGTAQAGGASTITLASGTNPFSVTPASARTDIIVGYNIRLTSGAGIGQTSVCTAYNHSTQVATVNPAWIIQPTTGNGYSVEDPVSMFRANIYPSIAMIGCNIERFSYDGLRFLNLIESGGFTMEHCQFNGSTAYQFMLHLFGTYITGRTAILINVSFGPSVSRSVGLSALGSTQDIAFDQMPLEMWMINCFPSSTGGAYNLIWDISSSVSRAVNALSGTSMALPLIPNSNPADGSKTVWANGIPGVLTLGT